MEIYWDLLHIAGDMLYVSILDGTLNVRFTAHQCVLR